MRRILLASAAWALCTSSLLAAGDITAITVTPVPIPVGTWVTYGATISGQPPMFGYDWYWRCTEAPGASSWWYLADTAGVLCCEPRVGTQDVRVDATFFQSGGYPNQHPSSVTRSINVLGPDIDVITQGLNTLSTGWPDMIIIVHFEVRCGSTKIGPCVDGYVEERIRHPNKTPPTDSGWIKGDPILLYLDKPNGRIVDQKRMHGGQGPLWDALPDGPMATWDFYQQNRLVIKNCHGVDTYWHFQERHFQRVKQGRAWYLEEIP